MTPAIASMQTFTVAHFPTAQPARHVLRVRWDVEVTTDRKTRFESVDYDTKASGVNIGVPSQYACYGAEGREKVWLKFSEAMQWFVFRANVRRLYNKDYESLSNVDKSNARFQFNKLFDSGRCFNNNEGVDIRRNYISGERMSAPLPLWEQLVLSGNFVEWTGKTVTASTSYLNYGVKSYKHYEVRCLNINNLPTVDAFLSDYLVCHACTTIRPDGNHGYFPQFGEMAVYPLWSTSDTMLIWEGFLI